MNISELNNVTGTYTRPKILSFDVGSTLCNILDITTENLIEFIKSIAKFDIDPKCIYYGEFSWTYDRILISFFNKPSIQEVDDINMIIRMSYIYPSLRVTTTAIHVNPHKFMKFMLEALSPESIFLKFNIIFKNEKDIDKVQVYYINKDNT